MTQAEKTNHAKFADPSLRGSSVRPAKVSGTAHRNARRLTGESTTANVRKSRLPHGQPTMTRMVVRNSGLVVIKNTRHVPSVLQV